MPAVCEPRSTAPDHRVRLSMDRSREKMRPAGREGADRSVEREVGRRVTRGGRVRPGKRRACAPILCALRGALVINPAVAGASNRRGRSFGWVDLAFTVRRWCERFARPTLSAEGYAILLHHEG